MEFRNATRKWLSGIGGVEWTPRGPTGEILGPARLGRVPPEGEFEADQGDLGVIQWQGTCRNCGVRKDAHGRPGTASCAEFQAIVIPAGDEIPPEPKTAVGLPPDEEEVFVGGEPAARKSRKSKKED